MCGPLPLMLVRPGTPCCARRWHQRGLFGDCGDAAALLHAYPARAVSMRAWSRATHPSRTCQAARPCHVPGTGGHAPQYLLCRSWPLIPCWQGHPTPPPPPLPPTMRCHAMPCISLPGAVHLPGLQGNAAGGVLATTSEPPCFAAVSLEVARVQARCIRHPFSTVGDRPLARPPAVRTVQCAHPPRRRSRPPRRSRPARPTCAQPPLPNPTPNPAWRPTTGCLSLLPCFCIHTRTAGAPSKMGNDGRWTVLSGAGSQWHAVCPMRSMHCLMTPAAQRHLPRTVAAPAARLKAPLRPGACWPGGRPTRQPHPLGLWNTLCAPSFPFCGAPRSRMSAMLLVCADLCSAWGLDAIYGAHHFDTAE
ncbi:MAG: hypothetical protein J3K34DRAFT_447050 [Monoraphidium minutum]|nr:MAG: hypothetical protein J3K34DRAFT_447050 [Monoraphidium minutum]